MTIDIARLTTVFRDASPQTFEDAISRSTDWISRVPPRPVLDGQGPKWQLKTGAASAQAYAEHDAFPAPSQFTNTKMQLGWGQYVSTLKVTGLALDQLAFTGQQLIVNYFEENMKEAGEALAAAIELNALAAVGPTGVTGIVTTFASTGLYAGVDRGVVLNAANYTNAVAGALTMAVMDDLHDNLVTKRKGRYDKIYLSQKQLDVYTSLPGNGAATDRTLIINNSGPTQYSAGFGSQDSAPDAFYRGVDMEVITGYPDDRVDFVDTMKHGFETLRPVTLSDPKRINDDWFWDMTTVLQYRHVNLRKGSASATGLT